MNASPPSLEEAIANAVLFLTNDKVRGIRNSQKIQFLQSKGLSPNAIAEAQRRAAATAASSLGTLAATAASSTAVAAIAPARRSWWRTLLWRALSGAIFAGLGAAAAFWLQRKFYPATPRFPLVRQPMPNGPNGAWPQTQQQPWEQAEVEAAEAQAAQVEAQSTALVPSSGAAASVETSSGPAAESSSAVTADVAALQQMVQLLQESLELQTASTRKTIKTLTDRVVAAEKRGGARAANTGMLSELSSIKTLLLAAHVKRGKVKVAAVAASGEAEVEASGEGEGADAAAASVPGAIDDRLTLDELKEAAVSLGVMGTALPPAVAESAAAEEEPSEEEVTRKAMEAEMEAHRGKQAEQKARSERIRAAVAALNSQCDTVERASALHTCVQMLIMYVSNLSQNPLNPRYRKIPIDTPSFKEKCGGVEGAKELLESIGFRLVRSLRCVCCRYIYTFLLKKYYFPSSSSSSSSLTPPPLPTPHTHTTAQRGNKYLWQWVEKDQMEDTVSLLKTCVAQLQALSAKASLAKSAAPAAVVAVASDEETSSAETVVTEPSDFASLLASSGTSLTPLPSPAGASAAATPSSSSSSSWTPPPLGAPVEEAPKSVDFARVAKAVQAGETLPGIRTIESRISSHEPSAATMAPRPKPWESNVVVGAGSSAASEELDSKEASESESAQRPSSRRSVSPQLK